MSKPTRVVNEGDAMYEKLSKLSEDFTSGDVRKTIIAKGSEGRKSDEVPYVEKYGIYFYIGWDTEEFIVYSSEFNEDEFNKAIINTEEDARIFLLNDIANGEPKLNKLEDFEVTDNKKDVYCVTTESLSNGSGIIMCDNFMKKLYEKLGEFYLIPSSVHEVMIVPKSSSIDKDYLNALLKSANDSFDPDVVLSYNVLTCDEDGLHI